MTGLREIVAQNIAILEQGVELLHTLNDGHFLAESALFPGGWVGAHFRHAVDHYSSLLHGANGDAVDYDSRERDARIERERALCIERLETVARSLERLSISSGAIRVRCHDESGERWVASSLERELVFLVGHTIHHYAIIAAILRGAGVDVPAEFGVAPSTLRHWRQSVPG